MAFGKSAPPEMAVPDSYPPPLIFIMWGLFFHPFSAIVGFHITKMYVPSKLLRGIFAFFSVCTIMNHVYHWPFVHLGVSLQVQEHVFFTGLALGVVPALFCTCRCFFLALPRKRALLLTVLNIFFTIFWGTVTQKAFGLPDEQPIVVGTPQYNEAYGWKAPGQHFATEIMIFSVTVFTYFQMAPFLGDKAHKA